MRVLHLISSYGFFGAERVVLELSKALIKSPIESTIGIFLNYSNPHTELADYAREFKLPIVEFPCKGKLDIRAVQGIRSYLFDNRIDVVHGHGYKSNIYAWLAVIGLKNIKLVTTCHNWIAKDKITKTYYVLEKLLLRRFHAVIAVSKEVEKNIKALYRKKENIYYIQNGINTDGFKSGLSVRSEFNLRENELVIGTVGRLSYEKGIDLLLKIAQKVCAVNTKVVFIIVGDGPLKDNLIKIRDGKGLTDRIIFAGSRKDVENLYRTMDMFILTSRTEGTPMAMLEAMASGLPVIASNVGGIPKIIDHGVNGILIDSVDAKSSCEKINQLLKYGEMAVQLGQNAKKTIVQHFSSKSMAKSYIEVYRSVTNEWK